ncbi:hypothetical protein S40293_10533 [Stachybotrys chartarum IBT 40293]|nr:hypothetical protein S40293_10533 [Stachybotrys chartarum IBT 40293]
MDMTLVWNPSKLQVTEAELLDLLLPAQSFQALARFYHNPVNLGDILIRTAPTTETPSAAAVLNPRTAFSSLYRSSVQWQAMKTMLSTITRPGGTFETGRLGAIRGLQHPAVGLLRCFF